MNNTTVASEKNAHASATASILHKSIQNEQWHHHRVYDWQYIYIFFLSKVYCQYELARQKGNGPKH